ncbi:MAG: L,D-transpeptidase family protein [Myxococcota bacterium]
MLERLPVVLLALTLGLACGGQRARGADGGPTPPANDAATPAEPLPLDPDDRQALAALAASLPLHGVMPIKVPGVDDPDDQWRKLGRKLLDVFAPQSLGRSDKAQMVAQVRPLAPAIDALVPRHRRYLWLQDRLRAYAEQAATAPAPIPETRYKVRVGTTAPEVGLLRDRLRAEGYGDRNVSDALRNLFDDRLKRAFQAWEKDHDLPPTVVIDSLTRRRLNEPLTPPIADVALALARWRMLDLRQDAGPQIFIDMTTYQLVAERDGAVELTMPVVVGKATDKDATPSRTAPLEAVIVNPSWLVPARIVDELRPGVHDMPEQLADKGFEVNVDENGKWKVRMPPGPDNPLGKLKFQLAGTNGIYLHDTPSRHAFGKADRTLSHGCVRLSQPEALARWLLPDRPFDLTNAMALPTLTQTFNLPKSVPVHFVYQTIAIASSPEGVDSGRLQRRPDIYGRDAEALAAIDAQALANALRAVTKRAL